MDAARTRYTLAQRLLHWIVAVVVILTLLGGLTIAVFRFEGLRDTFGMGVTNAIYTYHKTGGVLILGLMVVRLAVRLRNGAPPAPPDLPAVNRLASGLVHRALYAALIVMPMLGWAATATGDFPVQFFGWTLPGLFPVNKDLSETLFDWHLGVGLAILGLATVHVGAAIWHWRVRQDGIIRRISLP